MKFAKLAPFSVIACCFSGQAYADFSSDLAEKFPQTKGSKVELAFPGFYSVIKGSELMYVSADLGILITGNVIDLKRNYSISDKLLAENKPKFNINELNPKDAIQLGQGRRTLYVFADPDCGYCKKLEASFIELKDTKVFVFPFPLDATAPNPRPVSRDIWCQKDRPSAWGDYVLRGIKPSSMTCETPFARNLALGGKFGIKATPTLVFSDGSIVAGAIPPAKIEELMALADRNK